MGVVAECKGSTFQPSLLCSWQHSWNRPEHEQPQSCAPSKFWRNMPINYHVEGFQMHISNLGHIIQFTLTHYMFVLLQQECLLDTNPGGAVYFVSPLNLKLWYTSLAGVHILLLFTVLNYLLLLHQVPLRPIVTLITRMPGRTICGCSLLGTTGMRAVLSEGFLYSQNTDGLPGNAGNACNYLFHIPSISLCYCVHVIYFLYFWLPLANIWLLHIALTLL